MEPADGGAGWRTDPTGRFELRWFDGQMWTLDVQRAGIQMKDLSLASTTIPVEPAVGPATAGPPPSPSGPRSRTPLTVERKEVAAVGPGLAIGLAGLVVMAVGLVTGGAGDVFMTGLFDGELLILIWCAFIVLCTTMRYQPRTVAGFFLLGFFGMYFMRGETEPDSRRANVVAGIALLFVLVQRTDSSDIGGGPSPTYLVGQLLVLLAVIVGRKVVRTTVVLP